MGHVEYIEKLIEEMENDFIEYPIEIYWNFEEVEAFRKGVLFGMKYVMTSLKNPIDFDE